MDKGHELDKLFEAVQKDVDTALETFSAEELGEFVREFVRLCSKLPKSHIDAENNPIKTIAVVLYMCKLFPEAFRISYDHTDKMMQAEESIRSALEDL